MFKASFHLVVSLALAFCFAGLKSFAASPSRGLLLSFLINEFTSPKALFKSSIRLDKYVSAASVPIKSLLFKILSSIAISLLDNLYLCNGFHLSYTAFFKYEPPLPTTLAPKPPK